MTPSAAIMQALSEPPPSPPTLLGADGKPHPSILLRSAASGVEPTIGAIFERMIELVGPNAPAARRRAFMSEVSTVGQEEPADFFQVAIDKHLAQ